jgi:hypothetical protein
MKIKAAAGSVVGTTRVLYVYTRMYYEARTASAHKRVPGEFSTANPFAVDLSVFDEGSFIYRSTC